MKIHRALAGTIAALLVLQSAANALSLQDLDTIKTPGFRAGRTEFHPYYKLAETYDSNIYLVPRDQANGARVGGGVLGSWITRNTLGLAVKQPIGKLQTLAAGYEFNSDLYSQQSSVNNNTSQDAALGYNYKGAHGIGLSFDDYYQNTTDPAFSELVQRQRRWRNRFNAAATYGPEHGRLIAGIDYTNQVDKYLNPAFAQALNHNTNRFGGKLGYKVQPKTNVYGAYHHEIIHYPIPAALDKNNRSEQFDAGIEGQLLQKVFGQVQTGFVYRRYNQDAVPTTSRITRNWTVGTAVTWVPTIHSTVELDLRRGLQESSDAIDRFYIFNDAFIRAKHKLPWKLTAGVFAGVSVNKYSEAQNTGGLTAVRRDDIYQEGATLSYDIKEWITTGLEYQHRERNSIFTGQFNYDDHRTTVSLALKY